MSILYLVRPGNSFVSGRLSYGQTSTYRPRPTYYVTVLVFVCLYVCTTLAAPFDLILWYVSKNIYLRRCRTLALNLRSHTDGIKLHAEGG